jgi:hypothetical protein
MSVNTVEQAYQVIAHDVLTFVNGREWSLVRGTYQVLNSMIASSWEMVNKDAVLLDGGGEQSLSETKNKTAAIRFLRDDLLRTTGRRIWGLTFTLHADGKFNIEYDYNKPEGYEETDEVITGDEINASLNRLTGQDKTPD